MLNDNDKMRHYGKFLVDWAPIGYKRKFTYGVLVTKTKMFTADEIQAVADGTAKNQAIIQGNICVPNYRFNFGRLLISPYIKFIKLWM